VRKAAGRQRVIVTDNGQAIAELVPLSQPSSIPYFARRYLRADFKKLSINGKLIPRPHDRDITDIISQDRD